MCLTLHFSFSFEVVGNFSFRSSCSSFTKNSRYSQKSLWTFFLFLALLKVTLINEIYSNKNELSRKRKSCLQKIHRWLTLFHGYIAQSHIYKRKMKNEQGTHLSKDDGWKWCLGKLFLSSLIISKHSEIMQWILELKTLVTTVEKETAK